MWKNELIAPADSFVILTYYKIAVKTTDSKRLRAALGVGDFYVGV